MPIHDYIISNGTGAAVRADINSALSAIVSLNSNASEPGTMYAYQLWADTALGLLKIRNSTNSAWITLRQLDGDFSIVAVEDGAQATPSLTFTNDLNTGIFRPGNDSLAIVTGATRAITITSTQAVGIQTANPNAALHVAGSARVGADDVTDAVLEIGVGATGNRNSYIDIVADTTYTDYGLRVIRNNTGANATSELKHRGTGALNITTQEAAPIVFNTTNSPALTITSGGLVGIGTTSPGSRLEIGGDASSDARVTFNRVPVQASNDGVIGELFFQNNADSVALIAVKRQSAADDAYIQFATQQTTGGLSEKCRITSDGKLLVGTSSTFTNVYHATTAGIQAPLQVRTANNGYNTGTTYLNYSASGFAPVITLGLSKDNTAGSNTVVANNDELGYLQFVGNDGTNFRTAAWIAAQVDGTPGSADMPGRLVFSTTPDTLAAPVERMRITSLGVLKASNTGSYLSSASSVHEIRNNTDNNNVLVVSSAASNGTQYGLSIRTDNDQNDATRDFLECQGGGVLRAQIRSNGGLANYSANNANLSDRNVKKDITLAAGTWDCIKEWEIVNYRYKDQSDDADLNLGVIAQQVAESCPEVITIFQEAEDATEDKPAQEERLGVREQQMYWMAIKSLQEAMKRIEQLETEMAAVKAQLA